MKRSAAVMAALGISLAAGVMATAAATAASNDTSAAPPTGTFRFQLRAVPDNQEGQVDAPPAGPSLGDSFVFADNVVNASGKTIGHANGYCVVTSLVHRESQCAMTIYLHDGSIELAIGAQGASTTTLAAVGGTDRWAGARGEATLHALDPNANRSTLTLRLIG
jgi:hypothetical protein